MLVLSMGSPQKLLQFINLLESKYGNVFYNNQLNNVFINKSFTLKFIFCLQGTKHLFIFVSSPADYNILGFKYSKKFHIFFMINLLLPHRIILLVLLTGFVFGSEHSSTFPISIASSIHKSQLQMVITLQPEVTEQVQLTTGSFSHDHANHTLKLEDDKLHIFPQLDDERVVFNYRHDNQYLIAITHTLEQEKVQFLPLKVGYGNTWKQFLLPAYDIRLNHVEVSSLLGCDRTLISVSSKDGLIELRHFATDKKQTLWILGQKQSEWRHYFEGTYFGGVTVKAETLPLQLSLPSGRFCTLSSDTLLKNNDHSTLNIQKYYSIHDLLQWAPKLQVNQLKQEEL